MERVLLDVDYRDETGKFFADSYIKNKVYSVVDGDIHKTVKEAIESIDCMEMSYKGKPQGNIYVDDKNGNPVIVGYHYRCKCPYIQKEDRSGFTTGYFTAWVAIKGVTDYPLEDIEL